MSSGQEHVKAVFQNKLLTDERCKVWLGPGKKFNEALCRLCHNSTISVEKIGIGAVLSQAQRKKDNAIADSYSLASSIFF